VRLIAIESPCAGDFVRNRRYALWAVYDAYKRGDAAYASHLFYTQVLDDTVPDERAFGIAAGLAWAARADMRVFYIDLEWSSGMLGALLAIPTPFEYEIRRLPPAMLAAFERGEYPKSTPGYEAQRSGDERRL
jgi:hypothetical protein